MRAREGTCSKKGGNPTLRGKRRAVSVFFLPQGVAPGALTMVIPGIPPAAQEKEPESRGGGGSINGSFDYQCFGRAPGHNSVGFLGMLIRGCRGSPRW